MASPADAGWLAQAMDEWDCSVRWALRGRTPSPSVVQGLLWSGVTAQRVVRTADGVPAALFQLVDVDLVNGLAQMALVVDPPRADDLTPLLADFVAKVFRDFPLRKIVATAPSDAPAVQQCLGSLGRLVARLAGHHRRTASEYVDVLVYECSSETTCRVA